MGSIMISVPMTTCLDVTEIDLSGSDLSDANEVSGFFWLTSIIISADLPSVTRVVIGNEKLQTVAIESFVDDREDSVIPGSEFLIKRSPDLTSITVGRDCFRRFEKFTLGEHPEENMHDFDSLKEIRFLSPMSSEGFYFTTEPFELRNLPALETLTISSRNFNRIANVTLVNLPKLKTIGFDEGVFQGTSNENHGSLIMSNVGTEAEAATLTVDSNVFGSVDSSTATVSVYLRGLL